MMKTAREMRRRPSVGYLAVVLCVAIWPVAALAATVVEYRFDQGADGAPVTTIQDSGPNSLTGAGTGLAYSNATPLGAAFGRSLDASGDFDYGEIADDPALHVQEFTLELFAFPNSPYGSGGGSGNHTLFVKKNGEVGSFVVSYSIVYYSATQSFGGFIGFGGGAGVSLEQSGSVTEGEWHHVALRLDRDISGTTDQLALFVDGALVAEQSGDFAPLLFNSEEAVVGAGNFGSSAGPFRRNFNGLLDEIRLSDEALTPAQFQIPPPILPPGGYGNNSGGHDLIIDFTN